MRQRRPGVWEVRVFLGRDPVTRKKRQVSRTVKGTKREAEKVMTGISYEVDRGKFRGTGASFAELCEGWLAVVRPNLSPVTIRNYELWLRNYLLPKFGEVPVKNIETEVIDRYYMALRLQHGSTPSTIGHIHSVLRRALQQALKWGWITVNPAINATLPTASKPDITAPTPEQVARILQAANARDPELGHLLHLAATTGARRGEICALRWRDLDVEFGILTIENAIIEAPGGVFIKDIKTHASRRIKLDEDTLDVLAAQRTFAQDRASVIGLEVDDDAFIFSQEPIGTIPMRPDRITKEFATIRDSPELWNVHLHSFRHFVASNLIADGVGVRTVSGRLGHANASTTLGVYSHFIATADVEAANVMGRLVGDGGDRA